MRAVLRLSPDNSEQVWAFESRWSDGTDLFVSPLDDMPTGAAGRRASNEFLVCAWYVTVLSTKQFFVVYSFESRLQNFVFSVSVVT